MRYKQTTQSKIYIDISLKSEHTQNREESKKKWWHERKTQHIKKLKQIKSKICQFEIRCVSVCVRKRARTSTQKI